MVGTALTGGRIWGFSLRMVEWLNMAFPLDSAMFGYPNKLAVPNGHLFASAISGLASRRPIRPVMGRATQVCIPVF